MPLLSLGNFDFLSHQWPVLMYLFKYDVKKAFPKKKRKKCNENNNKKIIYANKI